MDLLGDVDGACPAAPRAAAVATYLLEYDLMDVGIESAGGNPTVHCLLGLSGPGTEADSVGPGHEGEVLPEVLDWPVAMGRRGQVDELCPGPEQQLPPLVP